MNTISLASTIAMAVGLAAALPQILRMLGARSANGQSTLGWGMGLIANASMGYVNLVGFHAHLLAASNALSGALCIAAMLLISHFTAGAPAADAFATAGGLAEAGAPAWPASAQFAVTDQRPPARVPVQHLLADLPTTEFVALRTAIDEIDAFRADQARRADLLTPA